MKKLISVTSLTGLLTLSKMASGFIIGKFVAVYIGPSGIAMMGQLQNLIGILNGLVNSPAGSGVVKFTAQNINEGVEISSKWWRASFRWIIIMTAIIISATIFFSAELSHWMFDTEKFKNIIIFAALLMPFTAIGTLLTSILNGHQQYKKYVSIGMLSVMISTLIMIALVLSFSITGGLIALSLQYALLGILTMFFCRKEKWFTIESFIGNFDKKHSQDILKYIIMAISGAVFFPLSLFTVRKIIIVTLGWDAAGQWQAVWKISETYLAVITLSLTTYFLPRLSVLKVRSKITKEIFDTLKVVLPITLVLSCVIFVMRDFIVSVLFTNKFELASQLIPMQLIGDSIKIIGWVCAFPMLSLGKMKWYVACEVLASISFTLLSYYLISVNGINGVVQAYIGTYFIYLSFILINYKRIVS